MSPEEVTETATTTPVAKAAAVKTSAVKTSAVKTSAVKTSEVEAEARARRKVREGLVVSAKMDKSIVVAIADRVRHPRYGKFVQRTTKLYAHDEENNAAVGDRVSIMETRPLSKKKRWRLVEVTERAK